MNATRPWLTRHCCRAALCALAFPMLVAASAEAAVVTAEGLYHFRTREIGLAPQLFDAQVFGAFTVNPGPGFGTTGTYAQGAIQGDLHGQTFNPNLLENFLPYNPATTGSWELTFRNGSDVTVVHTNPLPDLPVMPFVQSVSVSGQGTAPLLSWQLPAGRTIAQQELFVMKYLPAEDRYDILHRAVVEDPSINSYQLPANVMQQGQQYSLTVNIWDTTFTQRTLTAVTYTPLQGSTGEVPVYLPSPSTGDNGIPTFVFQPIAVLPGQEILIDPFVAIGYEFAIRAGDPLFSGVRLPTGIGDGMYEVRYLQDGSPVTVALAGGTAYVFPEEGLATFTVLGIEPEAGLDPGDTSAFVTGVTFKSAGVFAGTMTPITVEVPVPEPETWALALAGFGVLGWRLRRMRRIH